MLDGAGTVFAGSGTVNGGVGQETEVLEDRSGAVVELQASHLLELSIGGGGGHFSSQHGSLLHSHCDAAFGSRVVIGEEIELDLR